MRKHFLFFSFFKFRIASLMPMQCGRGKFGNCFSLSRLKKPFKWFRIFFKSCIFNLKDKRRISTLMKSDVDMESFWTGNWRLCRPKSEWWPWTSNLCTYYQNLLENWVSKQNFFVLILTTAKKIFFLGIKLFCFSR